MPINSQYHRAFSTLEVVISTLLVGLVVVGSLNALNGSVQTQYAATKLMDGPMLAEQLLAEIMAQPYEDPEEPGGSRGTNSGESGGNRTTWDDVDDYDGWSKKPPHTKDNTALTEFANWTRESDVWWAERINGNNWISDKGLKRIRVRAIYMEGQPEEVVFERYAFRSRWGALEQAPTVDTKVVKQIAMELELGGDSVRWTTNLLNHVKDPNN